MYVSRLETGGTYYVIDKKAVAVAVTTTNDSDNKYHDGIMITSSGLPVRLVYRMIAARF